MKMSTLYPFLNNFTYILLNVLNVIPHIVHLSTILKFIL